MMTVGIKRERNIVALDRTTIHLTPKQQQLINEMFDLHRTAPDEPQIKTTMIAVVEPFAQAGYAKVTMLHPDFFKEMCGFIERYRNNEVYWTEELL